MLKKGFLLPSSAVGDEKKNSSTTHCASSFSSSSSSAGGGEKKDEKKELISFEWLRKPNSGNKVNMIPVFKRDATVNFTHLPCGTEITRRVCKDSLVRGVVVVRCNGCDHLVPISGYVHNWKFEQGHDMVDKFLSGFYGEKVPTKGSRSSFCAIMKSTDTVDENAQGEYTIAVKEERDHEVAYTHPSCKTKMVRKVSRQAFERGSVVARCNGCNQLFSLTDYVDRFGRLANQSTLESFLCRFMTDLKQGTEDTLCVTQEAPDYFYWKNQNHGSK